MVIPDPDSSLANAKMGRRFERAIAGGLAGCVVFGTLVRYLGRWHWVFEITTHFVVQATWLAAVATVFLLVRRYWRLGLLAAVLTLVNAAEWARYYSPNSLMSHAHHPDESLVVATVNVYSRNRQTEEVHQWLRDCQAEVVFLSEVDPWWGVQIATWTEDWPHQMIHPREDNFGVALISKHPLTETEIFELDGFDPAVRARVQAPCGEWTVVGLHPFPPVGGMYSSLRNEQLASAARHLDKCPHPRVVLGDLNCSSSSPYFRDLLRSTGLKDSREGYGWQPTWPAGNGWLRIPIDHCLVDPEVQVVDRYVGRDIGSDHLPVRVRLKQTR